MSIEDRVRAATRARAGLVRQVRPLELPDELPARGRRSRHTRPARRARAARDPRHWLNWGAPIAAAALVTALALVLVLLRQAPAPQSGPAAPTSAQPIPASVPRYYAVLAPGGVLLVADDRTGRTLAAISPPAGRAFIGVTAAADDRTFVVSSYNYLDTPKAETTWYLLRITPGAAHPTRLTQLPIAPLQAQLSGLALSQDGRELAVMFANSSLQLRTYSVSSGALLGSWHTNTDYWIPRTGGANAYGLSWLADGRHVSFRFDAYAKGSAIHLVTVRTLDVGAAGHDLIADSRLDLQVPLSVTHPAVAEPCYTSLATPDGHSVICGTADVPAPDQPGCTGTPPSFVSYSTATGEQLRVLYQYPHPCRNGDAPSPWMAAPLWTDPSASQIIGLIQILPNAPAYWTAVLGLVVAGHLTPLPPPVANSLLSVKSGFATLYDPGSIAF
jgi:hypothetical protein